MADITDGVAPNTAFAQAMREAEAKAAAEQLGETLDEQPRDEAGRFTAEEQAAPAPEAVADETPDETPEPTPAETLLAGKYRTQEDLERGYLEQKAVLDRQGAELGELRQAFEQQFAQINERLDQPRTPQTRITPDLIEQNPAYATQVAFEQQDPQTLAVAFEQWKLEDPGSAVSWLAERRIEENANKLRADFEQRYTQLEQRVAPIQAQTEQTLLAEQVRALPDETRAFMVADNGGQLAQLAEEFPLAAQAIQTGTAQAKIEAIKMLYGIHRGRTADTLTHAATDVARTVAQEAQAVRDEAYVASSTTSEAETLTWEQQEQARAVEAFTSKASLWDSALVRPGK